MLKPYVHHSIALAPSMHGQLLLDEDFIQKMDILTHLADEYGFTFVVNDGLRQYGKPVNGAIVTPVNKGAHHAASAIDANIIYQGKMLRSTEMLVHPKVIKFGTELKSKGIRWGGFFSTPDSVHYDNGIHVWHKPIFEIKFKEYQVPENFM